LYRKSYGFADLPAVFLHYDLRENGLKTFPVPGAPMQDKRVSLVRCGEYQREEVCRSVESAVDLIGGIGRFALPGERILLKPNLLQGIAAGQCVTTHPEVVYAVGALLKEQGCQITIADSPGGGIRYSPGSLAKAYHAAGYDTIAEELGIGLNLDTSSQNVPNPQGVLVKRFPVISPALSADRVIVVSKAKTHMWTLMTGAGKNLFGVVPGLEKPSFHSRFRDDATFSQMIIDLNGLVRPSLQIMDAVYGMEGDGPLSGSPRKIGAVLASPSSLAMDMVIARLMGIEPGEVPLLRCAMDQGLLRSDGNDITLLGEEPGDFVVSDYRKPSTYRGSGKGMRKNAALSLVQRAGNVYSLRPSVDISRCTGCGKCRLICPVQAVSLDHKSARIDPQRCIRCYCCHEMCTDGAIVLKRGVAGGIIARLMGLTRHPG
jgi:uncharacterized protein (DUF362 family)/Pyruvate/2-oxoacid:ferredoxin oxidoreductase delta subunit